jgi:hypothetical protein
VVLGLWLGRLTPAPARVPQAALYARQAARLELLAEKADQQPEDWQAQHAYAQALYNLREWRGGHGETGLPAELHFAPDWPEIAARALEAAGVARTADERAESEQLAARCRRRMAGE